MVSEVAGVISPFVPPSHQAFRPILALKLLGIVLRNRCWPTTFDIITVGGAEGWCQKWPV